MKSFLFLIDPLKQPPYSLRTYCPGSVPILQMKASFAREKLFPSLSFLRKNTEHFFRK